MSEFHVSTIISNFIQPTVHRIILL